MITALVAGTGLGLAVCFLVWTLIPARVDHVAVLGRIDAARSARPVRLAVAAPTGGRLAGLRLRAGDRVSTLLTRRGVKASTLHQDLALVDRDFNDFLGATVLSSAATAVGVLLSETLIVVAGFPLPAVALLPSAIAVGGLMGFAKVHDVHKLAAQRRREFRRALSAYLDLVAMSVIGGTGLPEALPGAAAIGKGWPFRMLSETLDTGRDVAGPLSAAADLGRLGETAGISELRDLSIALNLSGEEGARIAQTLIERAKTLRQRDIADVQGRADERGASMDLPRVGIAFGFLVFVIYPLVVTVLRY